MKQHFPVGTAALFTVFLVLVLVSAIAVKRFVPETPEELVGVLYPAPRALARIGGEYGPPCPIGASRRGSRAGLVGEASGAGIRSFGYPAGDGGHAGLAR